MPPRANASKLLNLVCFCRYFLCQVKQLHRRPGMAKSILEHFAELPDPRMERTRLHKLGDILAIAICAVICGAEGWTDIELFGKSRGSWFKTFLELPNGIPSHDTFGRVISALDPDALKLPTLSIFWPFCFLRFLTYYRRDFLWCYCPVVDTNIVNQTRPVCSGFHSLATAKVQAAY